MSDKDKKRRGRRRGGGLRKHQEIENVKVEESFSFHHGNTDKVGEGCYVSTTTSNNKRYYGVLVDQAALKEASTLWFQDQADSLELNRRMKLILDKEEQEKEQADKEGDDDSSQPAKKQKVEEKEMELPPPPKNQSVQKFKYIPSKSSALSDYRQLLATFVNVNEASHGDRDKREKILSVCENGGGFVEGHYYQYEVPPATLNSQGEKAESAEGWRASMSLSTFLNDTHLPPFYPLSNLQSGNNRVLSMLNMKRDNSGNVVFDDSANAQADAALLAGGTRLQSVPMQPRQDKYYKIGVIGGGIAGLACCLELLTLLKNEGIKAKVTLLEARSRVGGRLFTEKFESAGSTVPLEVSETTIDFIPNVQY